MVWVAEDILDRAAVEGINQSRAFTKSDAEKRMIKVRFRFADPVNREFLGGAAYSQTFDLGKNEPHPVTFLATAAQFAAHLRVDRELRIDEALQAVGIGGHGVRDKAIHAIWTGSGIALILMAL